MAAATEEKAPPVAEAETDADRARAAEAEKPPPRSREPAAVADNLHGKMAEAQQAIGTMHPDRTVNVKDKGGSALYSYEYLSESTLMRAVRAELGKRGVAVYVSCVSQRREGPLTFVEMEMTFADAKSGETFTIRGQGQGADGSDKGVYKAQTGATRYMLWKTFLVPTEGDDPNQPHVVEGDRPPGDTPMSITEVLERLNGYMEDSKPWVKEAVEGFYDEVEELGQFNRLPTKVQLNSLARLQRVLFDLEDDKQFDPVKDPDATRSRVRAAFAKGFDGLEVKGPDPFAPPIPF